MLRHRGATDAASRASTRGVRERRQFRDSVVPRRRDPESAFASVQFIVRGQDPHQVSGVGEGVLRVSRAAATAAALPPPTAAQVLLVRVLVETSITVSRSGGRGAVRVLDGRSITRTVPS